MGAELVRRVRASLRLRVVGSELTEIVDTAGLRHYGDLNDYDDRRSPGEAPPGDLRHAEEVTGNISMTCCYYGITRQSFYVWKRRYDELGLRG